MRLFSIVVAVFVLGSFYLITFQRDIIQNFVKTDSLDTKTRDITADYNSGKSKKKKIMNNSFSVLLKKSVATELNNLIILRGRSEAVRQVSVKSQATGLIISNPLPKGIKVSENQILCEIEPGTKLIQLNDAQSRLEEAIARTPEANSRVLEAEAKLQEAIARTPEVMSRVLEAEAKLNEALSRTPEADSRVTEALASLQEAKARIPEAAGRVAEAKARLTEANINFNAAKKLKAGGYASKSRLASNESLKKQAEASLEAAKVGVERSKTLITSAMANIETAKAGVEGTKAKIKSAKVNIEMAKTGVETNKSSIRTAMANIETAKAGVKTTKAGIESARALVATKVEQIDRLKILAPFSGFLETNTAELGSLMQPGSLCATIVDLSSVKLVGFVPEKDVSRIKVNAIAQGRTSSGQEMVGRVSFISKSADTATRTFRLEVTVSNPNETISDGQTVEIKVGSDGKKAHLLPASALTLDTSGEMGVRVVNGNLSIFKKVILLKDTIEGVWVTGLNNQEDIIIVGQEYLTDEVQIKISYLGS